MKKILAYLLALCLMCSAIWSFPLYSNAADSATDYMRYAYDFSDGAVPTDCDLRCGQTAASTAVTIKDGALSLSVSSDTDLSKKYISFYIPVSGLNRDTSYHVNGRYKLASGTISYLRFGSYGGAKSGTHGCAYSSNHKEITTATSVMSDFRTFTGTFISNSFAGTDANGTNADSKDPKYLIIGMYVPANSSTTSVELLVDDLVFAEVIDDNGGVTATSADTTMGSVSVKNQDGFSDFAKGETAVFTATANEGCSFVAWKDATGATISTDAVYQTALESDMALTAHFAQGSGATGAASIVPTAGTLITEGVQYTEKATTYVYKSSSEAAYSNYLESLAELGYTKYSEHAIETNAASLNYTSAYNRFAIYQKGTELVHVAYLTNKKLHISIQDEADTLPATTASDYESTCDPLLIQLDMDENTTNVGMGYIFRLSDGRFLMIDGGDENTDATTQADMNYNVLREYQPEGEIKIAAWIFTHAHNDHINAFTAFITKYSDQINIGELVYHFPSDTDTAASKDAMATALQEGGYIDNFRKAVATYLPEVNISTAYSGNRYYYADAEVEMLITPTDLFPTTCATSRDFNTSSLVFKVKIAGQEILFLGDSSDYALNTILAVYGTALSADIVQMVHHGITYGRGEMYEMIGASVALWPAGQWNTITGCMDEEQNQALLRAPKTKEVILSYYGTRALALPYTPQETDVARITKPDGTTVDDFIKDITPEETGDIFHEDVAAWGLSCADSTKQTYRLSDGGRTITWGNTKPSSANTNGSDTAIYAYANSATLYATLPALKNNTKYQLSFDYMSTSTTVSSIITNYGVSTVTAEAPALTYNVYQGTAAADCTGTEVYGTGWNHIDVSFKTGDLTDAEYVLSFYVSMADTYKLYLDNIVLIEQTGTAGLETAYNSTAALRVTGQGTNIQSNGLRVYNRVSKELLTEKNIVEFGSLVRREENLSGEELTFDTLGSMKPGISYQNGAPITLWDETDTEYIFTTYLTGIRAANYAKDYVFRAYAKDADGTIYYGKEITLSVFDVAYSIDCGNSASGSAPSYFDAVAFDTFARAEDEYGRYADWLLANGKTGGSISGIGGVATVTLGEAVNGYAYSSVDLEDGTTLIGRTIELVSTPKIKEAAFLGWYDENDNLISDKECLTYTVTEPITLTAKYDDTEPVADTLAGDALRTALLTDGHYAPFFENSVVNAGNGALVGAVYDKLIAGEDITVVGFGGSITQGASASDGNSYGELVAKALDELGDGTVTYHNAGIGATSTVYGIARMGKQVLAYEPDLVLLDFSTNDQDANDYAYSYEAVLRTLAEEKIATVAILYGSRVSSTENGILRRANRIHKHLPSLIYYQIPSIEFYNTLWDHYLDADGDGENESTDVVQWDDIWADYIHPNTAGHRLAAGAITYYITDIAAGSADTVPALPTDCFFQKANYYLGSVNYQSDATDFVYSGEGYTCITAETDDPNGGTASAVWKPWMIETDGYIEFTVKNCKSFSYIRAASTTRRTAEIYINGVLYQTDIAQNASYADEKPLAWTSPFYYFDGSKDITIRIKSTGDMPFIIYNLQFAAGE